MKQLCEVQTSLAELNFRLSELLTESELKEIKLDQASSRVAQLQNEMHDGQQRLKQHEETLNNIEKAYASAKSDGKAALKKAKELSKGFTPEDDGFAEFREAYNKLVPDDVFS